MPGLTFKHLVTFLNRDNCTLERIRALLGLQKSQCRWFVCKKQMWLKEFYYEKIGNFQGTQLQLSIVRPYGNWKLSDSYLFLFLRDNMFPELFYIPTSVSEVWLLHKALLFCSFIASHFMWVCIKKCTTSSSNTT